MTLFEMSTSHRIEQAGAGLLRKDLSADALIGDARWSRPDFLYDVRREPEVYRRLLVPLGLGPTLVDSGPDWILVEQVPGVDLWQIGELDTWCAVMRWTAQLHRRLAEHRGRTDGLPLVVHDAALFGLWRQRAEGAGAPAAVLVAHEAAAARLAALPHTVIHGDLYPSNVLVAGDGIWAIDWELAGLGPAVLDVAALCAGRWSDSSRERLVRAYFDAAGLPDEAWPSWRADLDAARLHLCVQWLGWAPGWSPPPAHAHDWRREALDLAMAAP